MLNNDNYSRIFTTFLLTNTANFYQMVADSVGAIFFLHITNVKLLDLIFATDLLYYF